MIGKQVRRVPASPLEVHGRPTGRGPDRNEHGCLSRNSERTPVRSRQWRAQSEIALERWAMRSEVASSVLAALKSG